MSRIEPADGFALRDWRGQMAPLVRGDSSRALVADSPRGRSARRLTGAGTQIGQDGKHASMVVGLGQQAQLGEHAVHVGLHRLGVEVEPGGDGLVGPALGHETQHLTLPVRQPLERVLVRGPSQQALHHLGVDGGPARAHPPHGPRPSRPRRPPVP